MEIYGRQTAEVVKPSETKRLKKRIAAKEKDYPDEVLAAVEDQAPANLAQWESQYEKRPSTGVAYNETETAELFKDQADRYEVGFRLISTHVLALDLDQDDILHSLEAGHVYVAHDWLCDPSGFSFIAMNNLGVFEIGDPVPFIPNTNFVARFPVPAIVRLIHKGQVVAEKEGPLFEFSPSEPGEYRLEAWLKVEGEERPWIFSNPMYLKRPDPGAYVLPPATLASGVEAFGDIPYVSGNDASDEHRLDLYLPAGKKNFPVLMFLHGGSGPMGDRRVYAYIGNEFAKAGIGVVIPSYRLAPAVDQPAQIEDAAAAFAWVQKYIAGYGGDPKRIVLAGHSVGGGLAAAIALNPKYLAGYGLKPADIRGVVGISGVYRPRKAANADAPQGESLIDDVTSSAPRFLVGVLPVGLPRTTSASSRSGCGAAAQFCSIEAHVPGA